jgi:hypothetical protein
VNRGPTVNRESAVKRKPNPAPPRCTGDEGSTVPLILGFFLIALLFVGGTVALSDAVTKQRDLQSVCDGAAVAAANSARPDALHGNGTGVDAIPLGNADDAVGRYLANDPGRSRMRATGRLSADSGTVELTCTQHVRLAFGGLIARSEGIDQTASASARSPLLP